MYVICRIFWKHYEDKEIRFPGRIIRWHLWVGYGMEIVPGENPRSACVVLGRPAYTGDIFLGGDSANAAFNASLILRRCRGWVACGFRIWTAERMRGGQDEYTRSRQNGSGFFAGV